MSFTEKWVKIKSQHRKLLTEVWMKSNLESVEKVLDQYTNKWISSKSRVHWVIIKPIKSVSLLIWNQVKQIQVDCVQNKVQKPQNKLPRPLISQKHLQNNSPVVSSSRWFCYLFLTGLQARKMDDDGSGSTLAVNFCSHYFNNVEESLLGRGGGRGREWVKDGGNGCAITFVY